MCRFESVDGRKNIASDATPFPIGTFTLHAQPQVRHGRHVAHHLAHGDAFNESEPANQLLMLRVFRGGDFGHEVESPPASGIRRGRCRPSIGDAAA